MNQVVAVTVLGITLAGCAGLNPDAGAPRPSGDMLRPVPRPDHTPPPGANTAEALDTTSAAERQAAQGAAGTSAAERGLGTTIATLGNPAAPGFWLETPLVEAAAQGRVVSVATGESVLVDLIAIDGGPGAGSRISLAALRLLETGLTGLHELQVFLR